MAPVASSVPVKVGHIDDVQELRKTKPSSIPERFVRDMTERASSVLTPSSSSSHLNIPLIDLQNLFNNNNSPHFLAELSNLSVACQQWGFFQVRKYTLLFHLRSLNYLHF